MLPDSWTEIRTVTFVLEDGTEHVSEVEFVHRKGPRPATPQPTPQPDDDDLDNDALEWRLAARAAQRHEERLESALPPFGPSALLQSCPRCHSQSLRRDVDDGRDRACVTCGHRTYADKPAEYAGNRVAGFDRSGHHKRRRG